jgi:hypothetical protein
MKNIISKFINWLMRKSMILRCLIIAVLAHLLLLFLLASLKVGVITIQSIRAQFEPPPPTISNSDPDSFAAYRDVDYDPPGIKGLTPPLGHKAEIAAAGLNSLSVVSVVDVIGVVGNNALSGVRLTGVGTTPMNTSIYGNGAGLMGSTMGTGKGPWDNRFGINKVQNMNRHKASQESERSVLAALRWLKNNQQDDGSWSAGKLSPQKDAYTALAILSFLGHGHTADDKEFGDSVNRGLIYLINSVTTDGLVSSRNMYAQGAATLALSEAYGMTQAKALREPLERLVKANIAAQKITKNEKNQGGWRYSITSDNSDTSASGWILMGLKSARLARLDVSDDVFTDATKYFWTQYDANGGFGYSGPSRNPNMTAVGVLCQQFLGNGSDSRIKKALDYLKEQKFNWDTPSNKFSLYGWYYITQAMFQGGGTYWEYWNKQFQMPLIKAQNADGSWSPPAGETNDKVYGTTLSCLMLEVFYRYSPMYSEMGKSHK